ncbi:MAG: hypothetical protein H5U27_17215 [Methyloversatilis sp.]|nr:hypothetical protein [Methyloversatilis sp.]
MSAPARQGRHDVLQETVADAVLTAPTDMIGRVTSTAIRGAGFVRTTTRR